MTEGPLNAPPVNSVVLLGGGLDSLAALEFLYNRLLVSKNLGSLSCLFHFTYGNISIGPVEAVKAISEYYGLPLQLIDLSVSGGAEILPQGYAEGLLHSEDGISQYLPDRNLIFLSLVSAWVKSDVRIRERGTICYTGFSIGAPSIYDITPSFLLAINKLYALDTQAYFRVAAPFVERHKAQVLDYLLSHSAPIELTYTCYLGKEIQCGACRTCLSRIAAFKELGKIDPVPYKVDIDWNAGTKGTKETNEHTT